MSFCRCDLGGYLDDHNGFLISLKQSSLPLSHMRLHNRNMLHSMSMEQRCLGASFTRQCAGQHTALTSPPATAVWGFKSWTILEAMQM